MPKSEPNLTAAEVAQHFKVPEQLIVKLANSGAIPHHRLGPEMRFDLAAVLSATASGGPGTPGGAVAGMGVQGTKKVYAKHPKPEHAVRTADLFSQGLLKVGDPVFAKGHESKVATVVSGTEVKYSGQQMTFNQFGQTITGSPRSIYSFLVHGPSGKSLGLLRTEALGSADGK